MRYVIVDSAEFTYPDRMDYSTATKCILLDAPRNAYATFQMLISGLQPNHKKENWLPRAIYTDPALQKQAALGFPRVDGISIKTDLPYEIEWYTLVPVTVEQNHAIPLETAKPHFPERVAPYRVYDCLRPFDGTLDVGVGDGRVPDTDIAGLYGAIRIPADATPGTYTASVEIAAGEETATVPVLLTVYQATVPQEETLTVIQGYNASGVAKYHNVVQGTEECGRLEAAYLQAMRRMRQNAMYAAGVRVTEVGKNKYEFDFSAMEKDIRRQLAAGFQRFMGTSVGRRQSWSSSTILVNGNLPAMSYEGYCYLSQYLPALHDMLERNGWLGRFIMSVSDEPNDFNCTEFRALCGLVRKIVPDIRLADAMSYSDLHGALDIWIPLNAEYDKHMTEIETLRANGDEIWHYVCCVPRSEAYINRFTDYALLATRYLFWGNFKYDLTGYLHWAVNRYQMGQDPYRQSCPEHRNADSVGFLPAGDTHLLYPGEDGPWLSIRGENQREGVEEYEMLRTLAKEDRSKAATICAKVFRSFRDVEYDVSAFRAARKELLQALSELG